MRIGIFSVAHHHVDAYVGNLRAIPGVEMVGIADDDQERGKPYAEQFRARFYPSYEALLAEGLDGVLVCSENANHRPLVEMAAGAGVHVMSEKPLATSLADARAMVDACEGAGVILMTAFPMRFSAPMIEIRPCSKGVHWARSIPATRPTRARCRAITASGSWTNAWPAVGR